MHFEERTSKWLKKDDGEEDLIDHCTYCEHLVKGPYVHECHHPDFEEDIDKPEDFPSIDISEDIPEEFCPLSSAGVQCDKCLGWGAKDFYGSFLCKKCEPFEKDRMDY